MGPILAILTTYSIIVSAPSILRVLCLTPDLLDDGGHEEGGGDEGGRQQQQRHRPARDDRLRPRLHLKRNANHSNYIQSSLTFTLSSFRTLGSLLSIFRLGLESASSLDSSSSNI